MGKWYNRMCRDQVAFVLDTLNLLRSLLFMKIYHVGTLEVSKVGDLRVMDFRVIENSNALCQSRYDGPTNLTNIIRFGCCDFV